MLCHFTLQYWRDEDWFVGRIKEIPGIFSQGESLRELEENIKDAYRLMMQSEEDDLPKFDSQTEELLISL